MSCLLSFSPGYKAGLDKSCPVQMIAEVIFASLTGKSGLPALQGRRTPIISRLIRSQIDRVARVFTKPRVPQTIHGYGRNDLREQRKNPLRGLLKTIRFQAPRSRSNPKSKGGWIT